MILSMEHFPIRAKFGEEQTFKMLKDAGFSGVDYSFNAWGDGTSIDLENHIEKAKETKRLLEKYGLVANQAHAPFFFKYGEEMSLENKNFLDIVRSFEYASIIGVKGVVVHSIKLPDGVDFFEYTTKYYKALEPYAKRFGVKIAVENLVNSKFHSPKVQCEFIRSLNSDVFCACVDVGHSALVNYPPEEYLEKMDSELLFCVHLHDTDNKVDRHWTPFQGCHNWDKIMKSLVDIGFNGDMNLEVIHSFDNVPNALYKDTLEYIAKVGQYLINVFNEYKSSK